MSSRSDAGGDEFPNGCEVFPFQRGVLAKYFVVGHAVECKILVHGRNCDASVPYAGKGLLAVFDGGTIHVTTIADPDV
jgi:hypothetical protein